MAGRFEGVSDEQWDAMKAYFPQRSENPGRGHPPTAPRRVVNSILYILITGSRWCDLPPQPQFAPRSTSHRWHVRWLKDATWSRFEQGMLSMAQLAQMIDWQASSIDASFSPRQRRRSGG